jgi:ketosteroid isomerase-like protein
MSFDVERLLRLWTDPLPEDDATAAAAFREVYADPVRVNGALLGAADLVTRARALQQVFADLAREVLALVEAGEQVAVAFRLRGRQVGTWTTSAGPLAPTGRELVLRAIDVLTLVDGRITEIVMVADELGALTALDAVGLRTPADAAVADQSRPVSLSAPPEHPLGTRQRRPSTR